MLKKPKEKKCRYCKNKFIPFNSFQPFCFKEECIKQHNKQGREKKSRQLKKEFKEKDKSTLIKLAQVLVNRYVRLRDLNKPCISCGTTNAKWDAGHFESAGGNGQLRFNTINIWKQCYRCNQLLSSNRAMYRPALIEKIGLEKVEWLECNHKTKKYTVEYLQKLIKVFRKKIKLYEAKFR